MGFIIKSMIVVEYPENENSSVEHKIQDPQRFEVEAAIRKMDNYCYPIVILSCIDLNSFVEGFEDENAFNIIGGNGKFALFHQYGEWQYENPVGSDKEARLWDSDQGYYCKEKNIIYDIEFVLKIVQKFFETGSYDDLNDIIGV